MRYTTHEINTWRNIDKFQFKIPAQEFFHRQKVNMIRGWLLFFFFVCLCLFSFPEFCTAYEWNMLVQFNFILIIAWHDGKRGKNMLYVSISKYDFWNGMQHIYNNSTAPHRKIFFASFFFSCERKVEREREKKIIWFLMYYVCIV